MGVTEDRIDEYVNLRLRREFSVDAQWFLTEVMKVFPVRFRAHSLLGLVAGYTVTEERHEVW